MAHMDKDTYSKSMESDMLQFGSEVTSYGCDMAMVGGMSRTRPKSAALGLEPMEPPKPGSWRAGTVRNA